MLADRDPLDLRGRARGGGPRLEQTEIGGSPADVDDEDMPRLRALRVQAFEQGLDRAAPLEPAVECRLRLLQEPHAARIAGFLRGVERQALRGGVERGGDRDGDVLLVEREAGRGEAPVPGALEVAQGRARRRGPARSSRPARDPPTPRAGWARTCRPNGGRATTSPTAPRVRAFPPPCGERCARRSIRRRPRPTNSAPRPSSGK